jgi:hypothetical protein
VRAVVLERFGLDTTEVEKFAARSQQLRRIGVDSGLTAVGMKSVDCLFQQADLSLVIGVVLEQTSDESPDSDSGTGARIALVPDPTNQVFWVEVINGTLEILLRRTEIILCPAPRGFASAGFGARPILSW